MNQQLSKVVLIFGSTGGCGSQVYKSCVSLGMSDVRCFCRPESVEKAKEVLGSRAKLVQGDLRNPDSIIPSLIGVDQVVIAIGSVRTDPTCSPKYIDYEGTRNIVAAAKKAGSVKRIVYITAYGVDSPKWFLAMILNHVSHMSLGWKNRGEQCVRESSIPYTIVRPTGLKNEDDDIAPIIKHSKPYMWGMSRISRAVVGNICAHALFESPDNVTIAVKENNKAGPMSIKEFDFRSAFQSLPKDEANRPAKFEDHIQALKKFKSRLKIAGMSLVALASVLVYVISTGFRTHKVNANM